MKISKRQAKRFLLLKHGLIGAYKFVGKSGMVDFAAQAGCVQFDPIDVCGKNHELVFESRVKGFNKKHLYELLYEDRVLMDWFDKNQSICLITDWPYFSHRREAAKNNTRSLKKIDEIAQNVLDFIRQNGPVCSKDLEYNEKVDWSWAPTSLARAALDTLYLRGDLVLHHKKNTRKFYDLTERHVNTELLSEENPNKTTEEIYAWQVLRRIGSVGLLHNNNSYAFIAIRGLKTKERIKAFETLYELGKIRKLEVEGAKLPFFYMAEDEAILHNAISSNRYKKRLEFIAPLDNLLWDRELIKELFDFEYKWEIYTPVKDRKFGYYVLPVLYGEDFIGRIEMVRNKKKFAIKNIWYEDSKLSKHEPKIMGRLERFTKTML